MPRNTTAPNTVVDLTEVQIWPVRNPEGSRVKAMASIVLNGSLRVNGCRIIEGSKGLFLSYPSEKKPGTDQYFPIFHAIDRTVNERIQTEVLSRFEALPTA
ncbi:MAG TPA: septation protein SpoVG family protein [Fibrobacteria bacterium]|nr:septation protein SpoVG family protein [Fibrobacteria bacterium]